MAENESSGFGALLFGVAVGLVAAFLFAPRTGEETRQLITKRTKDGVACAADVVDEIKMQVESGLQNAGDAVQNMKERVEDTVADARERLQDALRAGQDAYRQELREREAGLDSPRVKSASSSNS